MDEKQIEKVLKDLADLRKKTEEHYRDYRNAGIAISTIFLSFITGAAFKLSTHLATPDIRLTFALMTAILVFSIFLYQVLLYGGFRFVAHAHYYQLMWAQNSLGLNNEAQAHEKATAFSQDSNRWFGFADKLFIFVCSGIFGHMLISGLIYFRIDNICGLIVAFALPLSVGICRASNLRT